MSDAHIIARLERHKALFDLAATGLGDKLLAVAADGTARGFDGAASPDGTPWPELTSDYEAWKAKHYPGQPMGRRTDLLRDELAIGSREVSPVQAVYSPGVSALGQNETEWFSVRRPFVGLSESIVSESRQTINEHMKEGL